MGHAWGNRERQRNWSLFTPKAQTRKHTGAAATFAAPITHYSSLITSLSDTAVTGGWISPELRSIHHPSPSLQALQFAVDRLGYER
jgi:hypothetical protein